MLVSCRLRRPTILEFYGKSSPTFNKLILIYFLRSFLASAFLKTVALKLSLFKSICKFYIVLCMPFVILIGCIFINFLEVCHACRFWFERLMIGSINLMKRICLSTIGRYCGLTNEYAYFMFLSFADHISFCFLASNFWVVM